jgi:hypothetical protein
MTWSLGVWLAIAATALAVGLIVQGLFPRYQLTPLAGDSVVVFDRWTGSFQRATYGPDGEPRASSVLRPF